MSNDEKCLSAAVEDTAATAPTTYYIYGCCVGPLGNAEIQVNNIEIMGDQTVYIIQDGSHTKMVQWPSNVAKYYTGTVDNFNTENWDTYNLQPSGNYLLKPTPPAPDAAPAAPAALEDAPAALEDAPAALEDAPAAPAALEDAPFFVAAAPVENDASRSAKRTAEGLKHAQRGSGMGAMRRMGQRRMNKLCFQ